MLVHLTPRPSEFLAAYLLRVAHANGYQGLNSLRLALGLHRKLMSSRVELSTLSHLWSDASTDWGFQSAWWDGYQRGRLPVGGSGLPVRYWSVKRPRICPACIADGHDLNPCWDIHGVACCPVHQVWLVTHCECGLAVSWWRGGPSMCNCGRSYQSSGDTPSAANLALSTNILALTKASLDHLSPVDDLAAYCRLIWFVDTWSASRRRKSDEGVGQRIREPLRRSEIAADALFSWPTGFETWLGSMRAHDAANLSEAFGSLFPAMRRHFSSAAYHSVWQAVRNVIGSCPEQFLLQRRSKMLAQGKSAWTKGASASATLGISQASLRRLVGRLHMDGVVQGSTGRKRTTVRTDSLRGAELERETRLDASAASRSLGLSMYQLEQLRKGGLILPVRWEGKKHWYRPKDIGNLVFRLSQVSMTVSRADAQALPTLQTRGRGSLLRVLQAALCQRVTLFRTTSGPAVSLHDFGMIPIAGLIDDNNGTGVSVREAARRIGMQPRVIPVLLASNCIKPSNRERFSVCAASLAIFTNTYCTIRSFARERGSSSAGIQRRLVSAGIEPVVPSSSAAGISAIWLRGDLASVWQS